MKNINNKTVNVKTLGDRFEVNLISVCSQILYPEYSEKFNNEGSYIYADVRDYNDPYVEETLKIEIHDKNTNELHVFEVDELVGDTEDEQVSYCINRVIKEQNMRVLDHECECGWKGTGKELLRKNREAFICPACGTVLRELW